MNINIKGRISSLKSVFKLVRTKKNLTLLSKSTLSKLKKKMKSSSQFWRKISIFCIFSSRKKDVKICIEKKNKDGGILIKGVDNQMENDCIEIFDYIEKMKKIGKFDSKTIILFREKNQTKRNEEKNFKIIDFKKLNSLDLKNLLKIMPDPKHNYVYMAEIKDENLDISEFEEDHLIQDDLSWTDNETILRGFKEDLDQKMMIKKFEDFPTEEIDIEISSTSASDGEDLADIISKNDFLLQIQNRANSTISIKRKNQRSFSRQNSKKREEKGFRIKSSSKRKRPNGSIPRISNRGDFKVKNPSVEKTKKKFKLKKNNFVKKRTLFSINFDEKKDNIFDEILKEELKENITKSEGYNKKSKAGIFFRMKSRLVKFKTKQN